MDVNNFSLLDIIRIVLKNKKLVFGLTGIAIVASVIISLILPNYYESTAVFLPYSIKTSDSRSLYLRENAYAIFGDKEQINRLYSFATSGPLYGQIIEEFDLQKHYDIKSTEKYYKTKTVETFDGNLKVERNDYNGIEITFADKDSLLAAKIVNRMVEIIDEMNRKALEAHNNKILKVYKTRMNYLEEEMKFYRDSINLVKKEYGITLPVSKMDFPTLSLLHKEDFFKSISSSEGIAIISDLEDRYWENHNQYLGIKENYMQTKSTIENIGTTVYIIQAATPAEKHARPVRWFIVASSTILTFILVALISVIMEFYKD